MDPSFLCAVETYPESKKVVVKRESQEEKDFVFDGVLPMSVTQEEVYHAVAKDVVDDVFEGFATTIFCYGQTGTGKTHTLTGEMDSENKGIIPRSVDDVFQRIEADTSHEYVVKMQMIQIYMERIQDLMDTSGENQVQIREMAGTGVYLSGVTNRVVTSPEECMELYEQANNNRTIALTKMNAQSSRSHACMILVVEKRKRLTAEDITSSNLEGPKEGVIIGKLTLVDLAGSERVKKTGASGLRLNEAKTINLSLSALGNVINALTDKKSRHVPFRDSKLTRLLQDSLGGNGKTSIIVTVGPAMDNSQETVSSLLFGQRAMQVENTALVNETIDYRALCLKLQGEVDELTDRVQELQAQLEAKSQMGPAGAQGYGPASGGGYVSDLPPPPPVHTASEEKGPSIIFNTLSSIKEENSPYRAQLELLKAEHSRALEAMQKKYEIQIEGLKKMLNGDQKEFQDFYEDQIVSQMNDNLRLQSALDVANEEVKMLREASQLLHRQLESGPPACGDLPPVPGFGGDVDLPAVPGFGGTSDDLWDEVNVLTDRLAERDREVENLRAELTELREEVESLRAEVNTLDQEGRASALRHQELLDENSAMNDEIVLLREEIQDLLQEMKEHADEGSSSGIFCKRGGFLGVQWQTRYFVLDKKARTLTYWKGPLDHLSGKEPRGSISLHHASCDTGESPTILVLHPNDSDRKKAFFFKFDSESMKEEWQRLMSS